MCTHVKILIWIKSAIVGHQVPGKERVHFCLPTVSYGRRSLCCLAVFWAGEARNTKLFLPNFAQLDFLAYLLTYKLQHKSKECKSDNTWFVNSYCLVCLRVCVCVQKKEKNKKHPKIHQNKQKNKQNSLDQPFLVSMVDGGRRKTSQKIFFYIRNDDIQYI